MVSQTPLLFLLLALLDELPLAPSAVRRGWPVYAGIELALGQMRYQQGGVIEHPSALTRPCQYSGRLFLKARVVMVVRHLSMVHALVAVLDQPAMAAGRAAASASGEDGAMRAARLIAVCVNWRSSSTSRRHA